MRRFLTIIAGILFFGGLGAIALLDGGIVPYPLPGALVAKRSADRLTGAACSVHQADAQAYALCLSRQAPIASYAEYRRCGGYIESERAGESRIACSKPELTDAFLKLRGEGRSYYREARRACRAHDFCYVHPPPLTIPSSARARLASDATT